MWARDTSHGARKGACMQLIQNSVSERLMRWTRHPLGCARRGFESLPCRNCHCKVARRKSGFPNHGACIVSGNTDKNRYYT